MADQQQDNRDLTGVSERELWAAVSYLWLLVFVSLVMSRDAFVRFHARQGLVLFGGIILAWILNYTLPIIGNLLFLIVLVLQVIGLVQALQGRWWRIPLVDQLAKKIPI